MRKATMLASVVIIVSVAILTTVMALRLHYPAGPTMIVTVRVTSDPPGATLSTLDQASVLGTTPLTMRYAVADQWRNCVSYDGLAARWPNGVQLEVRAIELCPEGGMDQEIRLAGPGRRQTHRTRVVPSQANQAEPSSDALTPMDLSVPDSVPQAAPASRSDALTPMDLSVPDSVPQATPASSPDALTPMDLSVPDAAPPLSAAPRNTNLTPGVPVKLVGYVDWSRGDHLVIEGQRVRWSANTRLKGLSPSAIASVPMGFEAKIAGWRAGDGTVWARDIELKKNGAAMFEAALVASSDAVERNSLDSGRFVIPQGNGEAIGGQIVRSGPDVERCKTVMRRLLPPSHRTRDPRVYVVESAVWNAFVSANGSVWVFRGLLNDIKSNDELAAVLGHELAHFTYEHSRRGYKQDLWASIAGQVAGAAISEIRSDTGRQLAAIGGTLALKAWVNGYSRDQEAQADRVGLRYAYEAGFDVAAGPAIWHRMAARSDVDPITAFFNGTHPRSITRAEKLDLEIRNNYSHGK